MIFDLVTDFSADLRLILLFSGTGTSTLPTNDPDAPGDHPSSYHSGGMVPSNPPRQAQNHLAPQPSTASTSIVSPHTTPRSNGATDPTAQNPIQFLTLNANPLIDLQADLNSSRKENDSLLFDRKSHDSSSDDEDNFDPLRSKKKKSGGKDGGGVT